MSSDVADGDGRDSCERVRCAGEIDFFRDERREAMTLDRARRYTAVRDVTGLYN